jgi:hypothetical protein
VWIIGSEIGNEIESEIVGLEDEVRDRRCCSRVRVIRIEDLGRMGRVRIKVM